MTSPALPDVPTVDAFASASLRYRPGDLFNPPALANVWGACQAALDPTAIQHLTFPPYSYGDISLGGLVIDGQSVGKSGAPITFRWRPDRIDRDMEWNGLAIASTVVMPLRSQRVVLRVALTNTSSETRTHEVRLRSSGGVVRSSSGWATPYSPREGPSISVTPWEGTPPPEHHNHREALVDLGGLVYTSETSEALAVHLVAPEADAIERGDFVWQVVLHAEDTVTLHYAVEIGTDRDELVAGLLDWRASPHTPIRTTEAEWNEDLRHAFTPGNPLYSGSLPRLEGGSEDLRRIYYTAVIGLLYHRREHPEAAYGPTFTTLMPRYWATTSFINDWSLSATLIALLDPVCLQDHIELWLERDIHHHFGTEYVSGKNAGNWSSCNDFAMVRLVSAYIRTTGDLEWLDTVVGDRSILTHVVDMATHVDALDAGHGLASGGDRNSLLECVGSYQHEVASINAGYVWALREAAALTAHRGDSALSRQLDARASTLARTLIDELYVEGEGWWVCRHADGQRIPVRHAWDYVHTFHFLYDDLTPRQRDEMVAFFERELVTPTWMRALASGDADADFSVRPDHQWNGSYPAWVALAARALALDGRWDRLDRWLPGLAKSANQGPYSQAHFVEAAAPLLDGGARKAPTEWPYITDWANLSAGSFADLVLLDVFGLHFGLDAVTATPRLTPQDSDARLGPIQAHRRVGMATVSGWTFTD